VPSANIIISQAGDSGQAGRSRDDLDVGLTVTLTNADNVGVYSYRWSMVDQPAESEAVLSGINSPACTFVPDEPGTYRIKLSINEGNLAGQTQYRLCAIRNSNGTRYFAYGEKGEEVNWDVDGEENTRGRTPDNDLWLSLIPAAILKSQVMRLGLSLVGLLTVAVTRLILLALARAPYWLIVAQRSAFAH
jgi:hypothetical protein